MIFSVFLMCAIGLVAAEIDHDDGEYGHWTTWRKEICEKGNQELYEEFEVCHLMEEKIVLDAVEDCIKETDPSSEGKLIPFSNAACEDISLFKKFDACFDEYEANAAFKNHLELSPESKKCYKDVLEKNSLESLVKYLEQH